MNIEQIKKDLRTLWKNNNELNKIVEATERERKRLEWLMRVNADKEEIEATQRNITILEGQDYRKGTAQLKNTYLKAFEQLPPKEKTIMTDRYINHRSVTVIADDVGYSPSHIYNEIIPQIIDKIINIMERA